MYTFLSVLSFFLTNYRDSIFRAEDGLDCPALTFILFFPPFLMEDAVAAARGSAVLLCPWAELAKFLKVL